MRVGLVVDVSCDLPESILKRYQVQVLPAQLSGPDGTFVDQRDKSDTLAFYQQWQAKPSFKPVLSPLSTDDFLGALKDTLLYHYDHLLVIGPHPKLSPMLHNVREGIMKIHPEIDKLRRQARLQKPFKVRVIESQSGYAGYGLTLYEALRLMGEKARSVDQLKVPLDTFTPNLETYVLPGPLAIRGSLLQASPFSLSWLTIRKYQLARQLPVFSVSQRGIDVTMHCHQQSAMNDFLNFIYDRLTQTQLHNRMVTLSYAGNLANLRVLPAFEALQSHIQNKQGRLLQSVMSPVNAAGLGAGALSVAFANKR